MHLFISLLVSPVLFCVMITPFNLLIGWFKLFFLKKILYNNANGCQYLQPHCKLKWKYYRPGALLHFLNYLQVQINRNQPSRTEQRVTPRALRYQPTNSHITAMICKPRRFRAWVLAWAGPVDSLNAWKLRTGSC